MTEEKILKILKETDYVRTGGSPEELKCAEYLRKCCNELEVEARIEDFEVQMSHMKNATLVADGEELPCRGYLCCGSGSVEAPLYYMPNNDRAAIAAAKGKIVLLDTGVGYFTYQDLYAAGAVGFITYDGNVHYEDDDIDRKELRAYVCEGKKIPGVNVNAKTALKMIRNKTQNVKITVEQDEYVGTSRNVVADIPGTTDEYITLTAHYDSTFLSHGAYDNMSGCIGLLGLMEVLKASAPNRFGLKFIFCGSEERGLLGSKAWVKAHESELDKCVMNITLDMIGAVMGHFIAACTCEQQMADYIAYRGAIAGVPIRANQRVYSSDSTPFADKGIPAVSFARMGGGNVVPFHCRYDTMEEVDPERLIEDLDFIACFADDMANAAVCPVKREMPDKMRKELDEYLNRRRKEN